MRHTLQRSGWLRGMLRFLYRENLLRVLGVLVVLSGLSAVLLKVLEPEKAFADWLWWSVVTVTTVGYGDITPASPVGRTIGILLMFFGIGVLSMLTAAIAGFFVELNLRRQRGMVSVELKDHFIFCDWNARATEIHVQLRADPRTADTPIVVLSSRLGECPIDRHRDPNVHFLRGDPTDEHALAQAGLATASTVLVLGDDTLDESSRDARVVLITLAVEELRRDVYTLVELAQEGNAKHCRRANADEIIVGGELSARLIANSAIDHGLSKVVGELLSATWGNDLQKFLLPAELHGKGFLDAVVELKRMNNSIALAVERGGEVTTNPPADFELRSGDHLILISGRGDRAA